MTNPIHTLRDALGEAKHHAKTRPVFNALLRAESALRELEADFQVLVEAIGHNATCSCPKDWVGDGLASAPRCRRCKASDLIIKRRLAEMVER